MAETNYGGYSFISEVLLFKITNITTYYNHLFSEGYYALDFENSITPVLNCVYNTYLYNSSIWNSYRFNPLNDKIVRYSNSLSCENKINMVTTSIHTSNGAIMYDVNRYVLGENETPTDDDCKAIVVAKHLLSIVGLLVPDFDGKSLIELSMEVYDFVKDLINSNYNDEDIDLEFKEMKEKYGTDAINVTFHIQNASKDFKIDSSDFTNYLIIDYEKIYNKYKEIPKYLCFGNKFDIHYYEANCNIEMIETICIDGYYISSQKIVQGCEEVLEVDSIKYNNVSESILLTNDNPSYIMGFKTSNSDKYFINSCNVNYSCDLKMRIYEFENGNFNSYSDVILVLTYYNNYKYYNISTTYEFRNDFYYIIYLELLDGNVANLSFKIRTGVDYSCLNNSSLTFNFNNNNEVLISYRLESTAIIGATFVQFSSLSITNNIDTIIEVYDSNFQLVAIDDDGYFDEELDDPLLGSITEKIPIYVNCNYYIIIRHRGNADNVNIKFTPIVGNVWYYNGDVYM